MILAQIFFFVFAGTMVASAVMVIGSRNPVHSVLFLILAFFNAAGLFLLIGAEFLAMLLVVVYVGAVAVLFLFVVMMLDIDFAKLRQGVQQYMPIGAVIGIILLIELLMVFGGWVIEPEVARVAAAPATEELTNTAALGQILFTRYILFFQLAGLVLLVAMIGAIVLTLRHKPNVRRQVIADQVARDPKAAIKMKKIESGRGLQ